MSDNQNDIQMPRDAIVVSGVSGAFPECDNLHELKEALENRRNLINPDRARWSSKYGKTCGGILKDIQHFDAGYFGLSQKQADNMSVETRMALEKTVEAMLDAGFNPKELRRTKTGVYFGICLMESGHGIFHRNENPSKHAILGSVFSSIPNWISQYFMFDGPSYMTDTACSSSLHALDNAFNHLNEGIIDYAIVGGVNLTLHPSNSIKFFNLGVLNPDGKCKVFDENANGYTRSEAVVSILLQRAKTSRRIYCQVLNSKTNCDGFKSEGINYPSGPAQKMLLDEVYSEIGFNYDDLTFIEAHGTGTKVGDLEECTSIDLSIAQKRSRPLYIGSVKSNLGHAEGTSGLVSMSKIILSFENNMMFPNINLKNIKSSLEGIMAGRMNIVMDNTPIQDKIPHSAINNFGFGGGNGHTILRSNPKIKQDNGVPKDNLPRLVCMSGRSPKTIKNIINSFKKQQLDAEHVALLHTLHTDTIEGDLYRGYAIVSKTGEHCRSMVKFEENPLSIVFTDYQEDCRSIWTQLKEIRLFQTALDRIDVLLRSEGIQLVSVLKGEKCANLTQEASNAIANFAIQIALSEIFKSVTFRPKNSYGSSTGLLAALCSANKMTVEDATSVMLDYAMYLSKTTSNGTIPKTNGTISNGVSNGVIQTNGNATKDDQFLRYLRNLKITNVDDFVTPSVLKANTIICGINAKKAGSHLNLSGVNVFETLLNILGRSFEMGQNLDLAKLYPEVSFPVSRGTPMIAPHIAWLHDQSYLTFNIHSPLPKSSVVFDVNIDVEATNWDILPGHNIDGRVLFPAAGYISLVWDCFAFVVQKSHDTLSVCMEDLKFLKAKRVPADGTISLMISFSKGNNYFEIIDDENELVVSGRVREEFFTGLPLLKETESCKTNENMMTTRDIYKELSLRGYNYKDKFRSIVKCNIEATEGTVMLHKVNGLIPYIDNLLQMKILSHDTRNLFVPTSIRKIVINSGITFALFDESPVFVNHVTNTIKANAIEIQGLSATSIAKRKDLLEPVLEENVFIPNEAVLPIETSMRVVTQLIMENKYTNLVKVVELKDAEADLLSPHVQKTLGDMPVILSDLTVIGDEPVDLPNITFKKSGSEITSDHAIFIGTNVLQNPKVLAQAFDAVSSNNGWIITRESNFDAGTIPNQVNLVLHHEVDGKHILLFNKKKVQAFKTCIEFDDHNLSWVTTLQNTLKETKNVVIYAHNKPLSGLLGFTNCLRREPKNEDIQMVLTCDGAPQFDAKSPFYASQLAKGIAINIYKNGKWGTYKHLLLSETENVKRQHVYSNPLVRGDLSSFRWIEGQLKVTDDDAKTETEDDIIKVVYAALNFKDVMTSSGRLSIESLGLTRLQQECVEGMEYSGFDSAGNKVAGIIPSGALATLINYDKHFAFKMPKEFSLEDAATMPVVYSTVLYAFFTCGRIKGGETILIHAGTGGIGLAAIRIALFYGCRVFTTVSTQEKRDFLKKHFPSLTDEQIGNSRDITFEKMIMAQTHGRGVDVVLNSLAEEKLFASVRCLARGGKFLEIGKFDLANDNKLKMLLMKNEIEYFGVMLDKLFFADATKKIAVQRLMIKNIENGAVVPLPRTVFQSDQVEEAFRYMGTGKHIGKVLIKISDDTETSVKLHSCIPRFYCNPDNSYIILGGLGGFGLELADWLVVRGARKLVLTSRNGVKTGYQAYRIKIWKAYGAVIKVHTGDTSTLEGSRKLITEANELGPVQSIFNLAVVLCDALFDQQMPKDFETSLGPKAITTSHLDTVTRQLCPELRDFVVFSSVSCGRGNAGQTNYGMSNSVMERIMEQRQQDGLPGLAIQWGAIGDVGLVAEMQKENTPISIGGTLQQRITNCIEVMDIFLSQKSPVVSSIIVAEKNANAAGNSIRDAVANILGITKIDAVSPAAKFSELGMTSLSVVEIKQAMENEFGQTFSVQDLMNFTFAKLAEMEAELLSADESTTNAQATTLKDKSTLSDLQLSDIFSVNLGNETTKDVPIIHTPKEKRPKVFFLPGIEGGANIFDLLLETLDVDAYVCQYTPYPKSSVLSIANTLTPLIEKELDGEKTFKFVLYSTGGVIGTEVVSQLEKKGYTGQIVYLDGMPQFVRQMATVTNQLPDFVDNMCALYFVLLFKLDVAQALSLKEQYRELPTINEKFELIKDLDLDRTFSFEYVRQMVINIVELSRDLAYTYEPTYTSMESPCMIVKATEKLPNMVNADSEDVSSFCKNIDGIVECVGNHSNIPQAAEVVKVIKEYFKL